MDYEKQEIQSASFDGLGSDEIEVVAPSPKICSLLFQGNVDCFSKTDQGPDAHSICITLYYRYHSSLRYTLQTVTYLTPEETNNSNNFGCCFLNSLYFFR